MTEFRVLGPVEVWHEGSLVRFARRQLRLILGILALEANRLVSTDRLIGLLWGPNPPRQARAIIQSRISELRSAFSELRLSEAGIALLTRGGAYYLEAPLDAIDAHQFKSAAKSWRRAASETAARSQLRHALSLWRGPVLGDVLLHEEHGAFVHGFESARLAATEDLFDIELKLGNHYEVVDEIVGAATANPTRERLIEQMLVALHRTRRSAEALTSYDRWRRWLGDELGVDPGRHLQRLHLDLLTGGQEVPSSPVVPFPLESGRHERLCVGKLRVPSSDDLRRELAV